MRVTQFYVKDQFVLTNEETGERIFQSCDSKIVKIHKGKVTLGKNWKYSKTTSKYRNKFLGETTKKHRRNLTQVYTCTMKIYKEETCQQ